MIIRCPECTTGFNLPDEQVTDKGVKVRCSKCSHVFRVSAGEDEEPEIFYRDGDSGRNSMSTKISPLPGLGLKPKKSSVFGDLKKKKKGDAFDGAFEEDDGPQPLELNVMEMADDEEDPLFGGSLRKKPSFITEEDEPFESNSEMERAKSTQPESATSSVENAPANDRKRSVLPEPEEEVEEADVFSETHAYPYGNPEDLVDPSFGMEGRGFDANTGRVVEAKEGPRAKKRPQGKRPVGAIGVPPTAQARVEPKESEPMQPASGGAPAGGARPAPVEYYEDDFAAYKIGGGAGSKVVMVLFLFSLVMMGFLAVVAVKNDGFLDFRAFPEMLEVAFGDGEYQPRAEWVVTPPPTVIRGPAAPITVESVSGELVSIGRDAHVYVVRGMVRNNERERFDGVALRASVMSPEGRVRKQIRGPIGVDTPVSEFRGVRSVDEVLELSGEGRTAIEASEIVPFTLVFVEPPVAVVNGESFLLKVEVTGDHQTAAVASQE